MIGLLGFEKSFGPLGVAIHILEACRGRILLHSNDGLLMLGLCYSDFVTLSNAVQ